MDAGRYGIALGGFAGGNPIPGPRRLARREVTLDRSVVHSVVGRRQGAGLIKDLLTVRDRMHLAHVVSSVRRVRNRPLHPNYALVMTIADARWIDKGRSLLIAPDDRVYRAPVGIIEGQLVVALIRIRPTVDEDHQLGRHEWTFASVTVETKDGDVLAAGRNSHGGIGIGPNHETKADMTVVADLPDDAAQVRFVYPNGDVEIVALP